MTDTIGVGVIGTGFMGAAHAMAFKSAPTIFETALDTRLAVIGDVNLDAAQKAAQRFGFRRAVGSWQEVVADPAVDLVSITTPNALHRDIVVAALQAGKHIYCEKPLAADLKSAQEMVAAAKSAKGKTLVGYNYLKSPAIEFARRLVAEGAIGKVSYFRGRVRRRLHGGRGDALFLALPPGHGRPRCARRSLLAPGQRGARDHGGRSRASSPIRASSSASVRSRPPAAARNGATVGSR